MTTRGGAVIDMLVLHYTGMTSGEAALERLCDPAAKVSAHYTIDEDGTVYAHGAGSAARLACGDFLWAGATRHQCPLHRHRAGQSRAMNSAIAHFPTRRSPH